MQEDKHYYWFVVYSAPFSLEGFDPTRHVTQSMVLIMTDPYPHAKSVFKTLAKRHGSSPNSITIISLQEWSKERYDAWVAK